MRGHACIIMYIQLPGGVRHIVYFKSTKIKHVTLSSTETEVSCCSTSTSPTLWGRQLTTDLAGGTPPHRPSFIEQDNESSIHMNEHGGGASRRTQHIAIRGEFITEHIQDGSIQLMHVPGDIIGSDHGTKPKSAADIAYFKKLWGAF